MRGGQRCAETLEGQPEQTPSRIKAPAGPHDEAPVISRTFRNAKDTNMQNVPDEVINIIAQLGRLAADANRNLENADRYRRWWNEEQELSKKLETERDEAKAALAAHIANTNI